MHNLDFMLQTLVNLALHYPQAGRTPAQLRILAEDWAEDLAAFPLSLIHIWCAMRCATVTCFPGT